MALGDKFHHLYIEDAREAYESLEEEQKQIVDAAIIKQLNREAYEASLRIYEGRRCTKPEILASIFDQIVEEYIEPDRITVLRGYMSGLKQNFEDRIALAREELAYVGDYYQTVMLTEEQARLLALEGVCRSAFNYARTQLMPMAPVISYILRAMKPDYVETQMPTKHIEMVMVTA